jgi:hypothetical protein
MSAMRGQHFAVLVAGAGPSMFNAPTTIRVVAMLGIPAPEVAAVRFRAFASGLPRVAPRSLGAPNHLERPFDVLFLTGPFGLLEGLSSGMRKMVGPTRRGAKAHEYGCG